MNSPRSFLLAALVASLAVPSSASVVQWTGTLVLDLGVHGESPYCSAWMYPGRPPSLSLPILGSGTALVNGTGPIGPSATGIQSIVLPQGAFATSTSVPIYNGAGWVNAALVASLNGPLTLAKGVPCTNFGHSAVGQGGMFLPTGTCPGAHGTFCQDGPFSIFGTGGLAGNPRS